MGRLSQEEMERWYIANNISLQTRKWIEAIRSEPPAERPSSSPIGVVANYASKKMGQTSRVYGHRLRLPAVQEYDNDDDVLEFYDNPRALSVEYIASNGQRQVVSHKANFFVIRRTGAGYENWFDEETLRKKAEKASSQFHFDNNQEWHFLPGETAAKRLGLGYRIRSSSEINWKWIRNIEYLVDYTSPKTPLVPQNIVDSICNYVKDEPGVSLERLRTELNAVATADHLLTLLAQSIIYVDLQNEVLSQQSEAHVYIDQATAQAHQFAYPVSENLMPSTAFKIESGVTLSWGTKVLEIVFADQMEIYFREQTQKKRPLETSVSEQKLIKLSRAEFDALITDGKVSGIPDVEPNAQREAIRQILSRKSKSQLATANHRLQQLHAFWNGEPTNTPPRTLRRWAKSYRTAEKTLGNGYVGLISNTERRGNRDPRWDADSIEVMKMVGEEQYEGPARRGRTFVYGSVINKLVSNTVGLPTQTETAQSSQTSAERLAADIELAKKNGVIIPSRKTVRKYSESKSPHELKRSREGSSAAYSSEPWYWELTATTPRHGERIFHKLHVDHTQFDQELIDSKTGRNLGRPWGSAVRDAYTLSALASTLSFNRPNIATLMRLVREMSRRYGRLGDFWIYDGGTEFHSVFFESTLAFYGCTGKQRPSKKSRFGTEIENLFGVTDDLFLHNSLGNTQNTKNVRQLTPEVNPKNLTNKTLGWLTYYWNQFLFETYDTIPQDNLGKLTPREARQQSLAKDGMRPQRAVPYDKVLLEQTRPEAEGSTRIVQAGRGIPVDHIHYYATAMENLIGKPVEVRVDPDDAGIVFARLFGIWTECHSDYFATFSGKSRRYVEIATDELRARRKAKGEIGELTAAMIADFMNGAEHIAALEYQAIYDREFRAANEGNYLEKVIKQSAASQVTSPVNIASPLPEISTTDLNRSDDLQISNDTPSYGDF